MLLGNGTWKIWQNEEQWDKGRKRCWRDLLPVLKLLPHALLPGTSAEGESLKPGQASALCFLPSLSQREGMEGEPARVGGASPTDGIRKGHSVGGLTSGAGAVGEEGGL